MDLTKDIEEHCRLSIEAEKKKYDWLRNKLYNIPTPQSLLNLYKPMQFTKRKRGRFEITQTAMREADVVNFRNAHLMSVQPVKLRFGQTVFFNKLEEKDKGTLTSDTPNEIYTQYISFHQMKGKVLVGGLGLGMAAEMILQLPGVTSVTVVEKEQVLINLIKPQISMEIEIVHADLFKYLENLDKDEFDSAYYDIWYRTREETWGASVVPLYRLSRQAGINNLGAWCEYDMWGQLYTALYVRANMPLNMSPMNFKPIGMFLRAWQRKKKEHGVIPGYLELMIDQYLTQVGTEEWEHLFNWR